jgi:hypothetical protein
VNVRTAVGILMLMTRLLLNNANGCQGLFMLLGNTVYTMASGQLPYYCKRGIDGEDPSGLFVVTRPLLSCVSTYLSILPICASTCGSVVKCIFYSDCRRSRV